MRDISGVDSTGHDAVMCRVKPQPGLTQETTCLTCKSAAVSKSQIATHLQCPSELRRLCGTYRSQPAPWVWGPGSPRRKAPHCRGCWAAQFSGSPGTGGGRMSAAVRKILKCKHGSELPESPKCRSDAARPSLSLALYDKMPFTLQPACEIF